jgi:hypothetical protein
MRYVLTGLSFGTDDQTLKEAFDNFGNVTEGTGLLPYAFCICWVTVAHPSVIQGTQFLS